MGLWKTQYGDTIEYKDLEDSHILNIKSYIERKSKDGYKIISGGGTCPDSFWIDEEIIYGDEVYKKLDYSGICKEINNRNLKYKNMTITKETANKIHTLQELAMKETKKEDNDLGF